jgi:hypothetical protein
MIRRLILIGIAEAVNADGIGIALGAQDSQWASVFWLTAKTGFVLAAALLTIVAAREQHYVAAAGFGVVGVFAFGFGLATSVQAHGFEDVFLGLLPGVAIAGAVGLLLIGISRWFAIWVRIVGVVAAAGFVISAGLLLLAAAPQTTPPDISLNLFRVSYILYLITAVGWVVEVRNNIEIDSQVLDPTAIE